MKTDSLWTGSELDRFGSRLVRFSVVPLHARSDVRLLVAAGLGIAVFASTMALCPWQVAVLTGWDTASAVVVMWVVMAIWTKTADDTARLATKEDDSRAAADVLIVSAAVASLVAVGFGLLKAANEHATVIVAMMINVVAGLVR